MKIVLVTCVWQRHVITAAFWRFVAHLRTWWEPHELHVIAAGSEEPEQEEMAREAGVEYLNVPNRPLGRKFNATLQAARCHEPDAVLIMGSDDVFCERIAQAYLPFFTETPYVGLEDFYFYHTVDGWFGYWGGYKMARRRGEPAGGGRVLPAVHLDHLDWQLWADGKDHGMDHSAFQRLREVGIEHPPLISCRALEGCAVSLKGPVNLWSMEQVQPKLQDDATPLQQLPADVLEILEPLRVSK